jgi:hypothetical protein
VLWLRQSTAVTVSFGPALLNTDGVTLVTNLTGTGANQTENTSTGIRISKNGGAFAARHATAGASNYDAFGNYLVPLDTTDTNTLGTLRMQYANAAAFCPIFQDFMVVNTALWDALFAASGGAIPNAVAGATGGVFIAGTNAATTITTALTTTFTGNLTGSVASVTGNVGGSVASVTGLTASNLDATISSRMATYTQPTGFLAAAFPATVASTTNITGGTITTVTNLTNAPTVGDLTAAMKASVTVAATAATPTAAAVTGAVGSVTGNVGGNVVGTVADVVATVDANVVAVTGIIVTGTGAAGDPWGP